MKVENKVKRQIISDMLCDSDVDFGGLDLTTDEQVEEAYEMADECDGIFEDFDIHDSEECFRQSGESVGLRFDGDWGSRHYEDDRVARELDCGTFVSWIYWTGGGKHGEPSEIDWMDEDSGMRAVNCSIEEKMVEVKTYSKIK